MNNLNIKDLDHLGIVAGIIDEMGLVEIIDEEVGTHPQEKLSVGTIVKAMILNCLGCINAPLYLFSEFFKGKASRACHQSAIPNSECSPRYKSLEVLTVKGFCFNMWNQRNALFSD